MSVSHDAYTYIASTHEFVFKGVFMQMSIYACYVARTHTQTHARTHTRTQTHTTHTNTHTQTHTHTHEHTHNAQTHDRSGPPIL